MKNREPSTSKVSNVKGIDAIFDESAGGIKKNACYPIFIGLLALFICWKQSYKYNMNFCKNSGKNVNL